MDTNRTIPGFYLIEDCPRCTKTNIINLNYASCRFCGEKIGRPGMKKSLFDYLDRETFTDCRPN